MAAKKEKDTIKAVRKDIKALQESFWQFRNAMLTDAALEQAEQQQSQFRFDGLNLPSISETQITDAATLMAAVGHPLRLHMTILLAQQPVSASELVKQLELGTTGTAYHHLNVLMNHSLVEQPKRGSFQLTAAATPRIRQLLTGLFGTKEE